LRRLLARWPDALCLAVLLLAVAWTMGPAALHPGSAIVGHQGHPGLQGDMIFQWNLWRQLQEGQLPHLLHSPYLRYPLGQDFALKVAFSLNLAIGIPFLAVFGLWAGHNLALVFTLWLNGAAMYALGRWRGATRGFSLGAALVFALGPFAALKLDQGFTHKLVLFPIPLFLLALLAALREPGRRAWALLFGAAGLVVWAYPPYLGFCGVLVAPLALGELGRRWSWSGWVAPVAVLALLAAGVGAGAWLVAHRVVAPAALDLSLARFATEGGYLEPARFFRWFPYLDVPHGAPQAFVRGLPLGVPVLAGLLALGAAVRPGRERGLALGALLLLLLMAGPWWLDGGQPVTVAGQAVPLPLRWLGALPLGAAFRMPIRALPVVQAGLLLAAAGLLVRLRGLRPPLRAILPSAAGLVMVLEAWFLFPEYHHLEAGPLAIPAFCEDPATLGPGALYHLPVTTVGPHLQGYVGVLCDRPMVNADLFGEPATAFAPTGATPEALAAALARLSAAGVETIVVHREEYAVSSQPWQAAAVEAWLTERLGEPRLDERWNLAAYRLAGPR